MLVSSFVGLVYPLLEVVVDGLAGFPFPLNKSQIEVDFLSGLIISPLLLLLNPRLTFGERAGLLPTPLLLLLLLLLLDLGAEELVKEEGAAVVVVTVPPPPRMGLAIRPPMMPTGATDGAMDFFVPGATIYRIIVNRKEIRKRKGSEWIAKE